MDIAVYSDEIRKLLVTSTSLGFELVRKRQSKSFMTIAALSRHTKFSKGLGPILYYDGVTDWK